MVSYRTLLLVVLHRNGNAKLRKKVMPAPGSGQTQVQLDAPPATRDT